MTAADFGEADAREVIAGGFETFGEGFGGVSTSTATREPLARRLRQRMAMSNWSKMPCRHAADNELTGLPAAFANPTPIRIWQVDDNDQLRILLAGLIGQAPGILCERGFSGLSPVLAALGHEAAPNVILLDIHLRGENGLDAIRPIKSLAPATQVLMLTTFFDTAALAAAMAAGASGFMLKSYPVEQIIRSIREAHVRPLVSRATSGLELELPRAGAAATIGESHPRGWWHRGLSELASGIELRPPLMKRGRSFFRGWLGLGKGQSAALSE